MTTTAPLIVADDDPDMAELVRTTAQAAGWDDVRVATSGPEALVLWKQALEEGPVAFVILDVRMPGPDGLEIASTILSQNPAERVILLSGELDQEVTVRARELGVHACVAKTQLQRLPRMIEAWLRAESAS